MKKMFLGLVFVLMSATSMAQTVADLFGKIKEQKGVQLVSIDKELMGFATALVEDPASKELIGKMDFVRILNVEDNAKVQRTVVKKFRQATRNGYETIVAENKGGESHIVLARKEGETINELVILSTEEKECALVQVGGNIRPEEVTALMKLVEK